MSQPVTAAAMVEAAERDIRTLSADEAADWLGREDVLFVDVRDIRELDRDGRIPDAFHCPRGMLEFWLDPASPYHKPDLAAAPQLLFFCRSGWRSALAAHTAYRMGRDDAAHIAGGFEAWRDAGHQLA